MTFSPLNTVRANNILRLLFTISLFALLTGCAKKEGIFVLDDTPFQIEKNVSSTKSTDGKISVEQKEYIFQSLPGPENIINADYDNTSKILFVVSGAKENKSYLSFLPEKDSLLWHAWGTMDYVLLKNENLLLSDKKGSKVFDAVTGKTFIRSPGYLMLYDDASIMASPDTFASVDIRTGQKLWVRKGHDWIGYKNLYRDDDVVYIVAEGLHALKIETGEKWEYLTSTSYTNHGKEMALQVATSCLAAAAGSYNTRQYKPEVTHNMCSDPFFTKDKVLFAARNKMLCFNKKSGALLWEANIDPELEGMELYYVSEKEVALVGTGLKLLDFRVRKSENPTVRIFDIESGRMTGYFALDKENHTYIQSFYAKGGKNYLLTPQNLYILDKDLRQETVIETNREYGDFLGILSVDSALVLRCANGVAALKNENFKEKWFWYAAPGHKSVAEPWMQAISDRRVINAKSVSAGGYYFTPCENSSFKALNLSTGKEVLALDFYDDTYELLSGLQLLNYRDAKAKLVSLKVEE